MEMNARGSPIDPTDQEKARIDDFDLFRHMCSASSPQGEPGAFFSISFYAARTMANTWGTLGGFAARCERDANANRSLYQAQGHCSIAIKSRWVPAPSAEESIARSKLKSAASAGEEKRDGGPPL